jgi:tRNA1Val (adenine37-N6)-methyltransferase
LARHESTAGIIDFLKAAKYLVKPGGRVAFIYHPSRLPEFMAHARDLRLNPLRLRMVHGTAAAEARMFLVELAKDGRGDLVVLPPLVVFDQEGNYLPELHYLKGE